MTTEEIKEQAALEKKLKALQKELEHAQMKNIVLDTLINVAEKKLNINIRHKPGSKS